MGYFDGVKGRREETDTEGGGGTLLKAECRGEGMGGEQNIVIRSTHAIGAHKDKKNITNLQITI